MSENRKGEKHPQYGKVSALKGRTLTEETKAKISQKKMGVRLSEETKAKISASKRGFKHSEETKEKLRLNAKLNPSKYVHSKETLEKISKALSGSKHPLFGSSLCEEIKLKLSRKLSSPVEVTDLKINTNLVYNTSREAAESFPCSISTINKCIRTQKLYKNRYKITRVKRSLSTFIRPVEYNEIYNKMNNIISKLDEGENPELNTASLLEGDIIKINLKIMKYLQAALSMVKAILPEVYIIGASLIGPSLAKDRTSNNELGLVNWILAKGRINQGVIHTHNLWKGLPKDIFNGAVNQKFGIAYGHR